MWTILLLVVVALVALFVVSRSLSAKSLPVSGSVAPEFSLSSEDGSQVSLKAFRGKWVVLYFYPKDFTTGCTIEAHNFQRDQAEYARRNAVILGVSVDSAESHKNFCAKEGLNFKLLADTKHQVSKQYGSLMNFGVAQISARNTFLIDPQGKIARAFSSVNPSRHSAEMLAVIDELEKPTPVP
jgi:thioredoxin-dependent peroxiredoxin